MPKKGSGIKQLHDYLTDAYQQTAAGNLSDAERLWLQVIALDPDHQEAHEQLVMIALRRGDVSKAEQFLKQLVYKHPNEPLYGERLASFLAHQGRLEEAAKHYSTVLTIAPSRTKTRFNYARLLKQMGRRQDAIAEYRECIDQGIERPEEVFSNISVAYTELHQNQQASAALETALQHNSDYIPALFNLGLLREEQGSWPQAVSLYERILQQKPLHPGALVHLANGYVGTEDIKRLSDQLLSSLSHNDTNELDQEELLYALGKLYDQTGQFDDSFGYYQQANELSKNRCEAYDRIGQERLVSNLIAHCNDRWLDSIKPVSQASFVFVCGMFRSGTTLLEQMLAMHPALQSGGEIDFFQRHLSPFPDALLAMGMDQLRSLGQGYIDYLDECFTGEHVVVNKRPDNFLIAGLIKGLFPNSKILLTQRGVLDNCLSLYFQPFVQAQSYANDLIDSGHYYQQHTRLISHWQTLLGDNLLTVQYESLVKSTRESLQEALAFLDLEWSEDCLRFHETKNRIRTVSAHQVRKPLYSQSIARWRNYQQPLEALRTYLGPAAS